MLIDFKSAVKKHQLNIKGVIQVGAHFAEEYEDYKSMGIKDIVFIEPAKKAFYVLDEKFAKNLNVRLFNYAMGSKFGMVFLNTEEKNNGQSNSLLKPKLHLQQFPDIVFNGHERVELRTLDSLDMPRQKYNTLVMDVQGYEGEVIKGAAETLKNIDTIYTEVNRAEVYEGCVQIDELDYLLSDFERVETSWAGGTWGDAIYKRKAREVSPPVHIGNIVDVPKIFMQADRTPYPEDNTPAFEEWFCENYSGYGSRIYLPVMWTSYYKNHDYGNDKYSVNLLQEFLDRLDRDKKYFTIVQYDDGIINDISKLDIQVFSMSGYENSYPLPLICQPHSLKFQNERDIFCSFVGRDTHPIRRKMIGEAVKSGHYVKTSNHTLKDYCSILSRSTFTLCPRGYGMSSFRIMEAIQYGSIPVYISDKFVLPHGFKFDYGVVIHERQLDELGKILNSIPQEAIANKQSVLKDVFFDLFSFEANRKHVMMNIK